MAGARHDPRRAHPGASPNLSMAINTKVSYRSHGAGMRRARDGGSNDFHVNDIPKNRARWALALAANTHIMKKQHSTDKQRSEDAGRLACTRTGECACCGTPAACRCPGFSARPCTPPKLMSGENMYNQAESSHRKSRAIARTGWETKLRAGSNRTVVKDTAMQSESLTAAAMSTHDKAESSHEKSRAIAGTGSETKLRAGG
jgi:hypothetical protein